ncbi:MAG: AzlD domain-containing protein [Anaerolineales bacterium]|nr:AzlD domain-containing protein [Anaerolineales bacterium]MCB8962680.1 AzlD domain-containing protein [Ardenticatenales bacterium]
MRDLLVIIGMGLVTYLIRVGPFLMLSRWELPQSWQRGLQYVPAAVLAAIIVPEVLVPAGGLQFTPGNPRLLAALIALLVAWRWQNAVLTVVVGMVALWLLALL